MFGVRRLYSTVQAAATVPETVLRRTLKPLDSRKTFLVDLYTHMLRSNAVVLVLHNSTLLLAEDRALRSELAKAGGQLNIVRSSLMKVALQGLHAPDPAVLRKQERKPHPLAAVLQGPTAVVTVPELDPAAVDRVIQIIDKSQNRLVLLGGLVQGLEGAVFRNKLDELRKLPTLPVLHAQLAGVLTILGGAGLTQTLEATQQSLALALTQHAKREE